MGLLGAVGLVLLGSGRSGGGTGIVTCGSLVAGVVGIVVLVGSGVEAGDGKGFVNPGEVILWAIPVLGGCANVGAGNAIERVLIAIVAIIGTKNKPKSVTIRLENKLNLGI